MTGNQGLSIHLGITLSTHFSVIPNPSRTYKRLTVLQSILQWLELLGLLCFILVGFWTFYSTLCTQETCRSLSLNVTQSSQLIQMAIPAIGIFNSLRIGIVYLLHDPDDQPETLFYLSLVGLATAFVTFGLFFPQFVAQNNHSLQDNPIVLLQLLILMISTSLLLAEKQTWDKSIFFIRLRLSTTIIHLILLLINPWVGILASALLFPIGILQNPYPKHSDTQISP